MDFEAFQDVSQDGSRHEGDAHSGTGPENPAAMGGDRRFNHLPSAKAKRDGDLRAEHRHTLALEAEIHFQEQQLNGMFRCQTSNIGLSGAFLPSRHMPLTGFTDVEVVFRAPSRSRQQQYRLNAKVVRTGKRGAALRFEPSSDEQRQDFRRFLLHAKIAARH